MALRMRQTVFYLPMRVWDAPTRLFHWLLVVLLPADYATGQLGWMDLHLQLGYALLALFLFRVAWGFIGSDTARFGRFWSARCPDCGIWRCFSDANRTPRSATMPPAVGWCWCCCCCWASSLSAD